jgi:hypothetical protein
MIQRLKKFSERLIAQDAGSFLNPPAIHGTELEN